MLYTSSGPVSSLDTDARLLTERRDQSIVDARRRFSNMSVVTPPITP